MPEYSYKARTPEGKLTYGSMEAESQTAVANILFKNNLAPIDIILAKKSNSKNKTTKIPLFNRSVPFEEIIMLCRQLASLIGAGLPIATSLNRLAESARSKALKAALTGVSNAVESGKTLGVALAQYPDIFPSIFINLVETGENTGKLDEAFKQLVGYLELELSIKRRIKTVLRYPLTVVIAITAALVIINIFVIPSFTSLFAQFRAELPLPTRILMKSSYIFIHYWKHMLGVVVFIIAAFKLYLKTKSGRLSFDRMKLRLPLFGKITKEILLVRFSSLFSMIFRSGVPLAKGMELLAQSSGNAYMKTVILKMRDGIESGETILNVAKLSKLFPPLVIQMIEVGEESGTIDKMLEQVADYYEGEVDYSIKNLSDAIEPILLIFIAIMVLMIALGVFLPMWNIASVAH